LDKLRLPNGSDDDIGIFDLNKMARISAKCNLVFRSAHNCLDVFRAAVTLGNSCVAVAEHRSNGAAHNVAAAEHHSISARERDASGLEKADDGGRRAGRE
jgi:hypothetical protein